MKKAQFFLTFCLLLLSCIVTAEEQKRKRVCLNMIVKNEKEVIKRSLKTVKPFIDYWVIVDTGSTDGTQEIIKEFMKDIPGELHEDPFVNFEYSRNKALSFAKNKADYILFIDADEEFDYDKDFKLPPLEKDFYHIKINNNGNEYVRRLLIKDGLNWHWVGVLHEVIVSDQARTHAVIEGIKNIYHTDGARSKDPLKYQKDAQMLEEALKKKPNSTRTTFYLAQSYRDAKDHTKALEWYAKRVAMEGWNQEVFWAMLEVARMKQALDRPAEDFIPEYLKAYQYRPIRAEPLYYIANYYRLKGDYLSGYLIASMAYNIPTPDDTLFVRKWMYDYGIPIELSICAYWIGKYEECKQISLKMLNNPDLPKHVLDCAKDNLSFANKKLKEEKAA
ncbi:MAG: glycosyltransferase [Chlamydiales bacterium]